MAELINIIKFCFGNVPPPRRLKVPVYTYFHNINMLTLADCRGWKQKLKFFLKREYIRSIRRNSDEWFVQTSNTANELIRHLGVSDDNVELYPFYRPPVVNATGSERTDYIFVGNDSGSKGHKELLDVWKELYKRGIERTLHLTVSSESRLYPAIEDLSKQGVKIVNHGIIPTEELFELYTHCKATVYPSRNESFGLGIVEAMEAGCDVIGADLPYMHAVCTPSEVFDPFSSESILKAVLKYEKKPRHTYQHARNLVNELIDEMTA